MLDTMSRLQEFDEEEYSKASQKLKDRFQEEVETAFPADYLWNNL